MIIVIIYVNIVANDLIYMQEHLTPLHLALLNGYADIASLLVNSGANINAETQVSIVNEDSVRVYC